MKQKYSIRFDGYDIDQIPHPVNLKKKEDMKLDSAIIGAKRFIGQWFKENEDVLRKFICATILEFDFETEKERIICTIEPIFELKDFKKIKK